MKLYTIMSRQLAKMLVMTFFVLLSAMSVQAQSVSGTASNNGCQNSGIVTATATGLTAPVQYQLLLGSTVVAPVSGDATQFTNTNVFPGLAPGSYTLKAKGAGGGTEYTSTAIPVTDGFTSLGVTTPTKVNQCIGGSSVLVTTVTGGKAPFVYRISTSAAPTTYLQTSVSTSSRSYSFAALATGSYLVSVTDDCGQTITAATAISDRTITVNDITNAANTVSRSDCAADITLFTQFRKTSGTFSATDLTYFTYKIKYQGVLYGKDPGGGAYAVAGGAGFPLSDGTDITRKLPITATAAGVLADLANMKTVVDDGCGNTKELQIVKDESTLVLQNCGGNALIGYGLRGLLCYPLSVTFTNASNPSDVHSFTWTTSGNSFSAPLTPGAAYNLTYKDGSGATTGYFSSTTYAVPATSSFNPTAWFTGLSTTYLGYGTFGISVTPFLITHVISYSVTASTSPLVPVGYSNTVAFNALPPNFGTSNLVYLPKPNAAIPNEGFGLWPKGTYSLEITSPCGTKSLLNFTVAGLALSLTGNTLTPICGGFNYVLNGVFDQTNYEVVITSGPTNVGLVRDLASTSASLPFNGLGYGTYTFGVRYKGATSILASQTVTYGAANVIVVNVANTGGYVCTAGATDGVLSISAISNSPGSGSALTYALSTNGGATYGAYQSSNVFTGLAAGTYYYKILDGCGNEITQTVQLGVAATPTATANGVTNAATVCQQTTGTIQLNVDVSGASSYLWTGPGITAATKNLKNPTVPYSGLSAGPNSYSCTIVLGAPCNTTTVAPLVITVNAAPNLIITNPAAVCTLNSVNLTAAAVTAGSNTGLTYTYFTDAAATVALATPSAVAVSGTYYIKATNSNLCTTVSSVSVVINPLPTASISYSGSPFCKTGTKAVTLLGTTGGSYTAVAGLSINASSGLIDLAASTVGSYIVTYSFTNGTCASTATATITINALPVANATSLTVTDATGFGVGNFTVANATTAVEASNTLTVTTTYYATQAQADAGTPALSSPYSATTGTVVFARVASSSCYATAPVTLFVRPAVAITSPVNVTIGTAASNSSNPPISGTATALASVTVNGPNGQVCSTTATAAGSWTCTSLTFTPGSQTVTAVASNTGGVSTVATSSFTVVSSCTNPSVGGTVAYMGTLPLCSLSNAGSLTLTGQTGAVTGWETSTNGGTSFSAIGGTAGKTFYTFINAQTNQQYRAIVSNGAGCSAVSAASVTVTTAPGACSSATCDNTTGVITIGAISGAVGSNLINQLIVTDLAGTIQYASAQNVLTVSGVVPGNYIAYGVTFDNTQTPLPTLTVGTNLSVVGGACVKYSNPLAYKICPAPIVITGPANGATVASLNPPISGTAAPGASVTVTGGTGSSGGPCVTFANGSGVWQCTSLTFANGQPASVTATNGTTSAVSNFTVAAPPSVTINGPAPGSTVASLNPPISGTATPGTSVTVTGGPGSTGGPCVVTASASGTYACTSLTFTNGPASVTARTSDNGVLSSPVVTTFTVAVPPTVAITTPATSGTATLSPTISGTATPNAVVTINGGPGSVGGPVSVTAGPTGAYSTTALTFPPGPNSVTAVATNAGGTSTPAVSNFTAVAPASLTVSSPVNVSTVSTPTISGTATPNAVIVITNPAGQTVCQTTASTTGAFACGPINGLPTGTNNLTVTARGPGGSASVPISFTTVLPPTVAINGPAPGQVVATSSPLISGTATPGSSVTLTAGPGSSGGPLSLTTNPVTGAWSTSALTFAGGLNSVTAISGNAGGSSSPATTSFSVVAPLAVNTNPATLTATPGTSTSAIAATALSPAGGVQPLVYSVFNPASGSAISSSGPIATPNGLVSINPVTGVYSYTPTAGYSGTDVIGIKVCDSSSPTPQCVSSIIPILIPPTVAILSPATNGTATLSPTISGTATPNAVVTINGGPGSMGGPVSVTANPITGAYSTTAISFPAGLASVTAIATNAGGTSSPAISSFTAVAPASLTVSGPVNVSTVASPTISGTATPNAVIVITNPAGQIVCSTTATTGGTFACGPINGLPTGTNNLTVTATTPGGSASQPISFTTVPPPTVAINGPTNGQTVATSSPLISGTATPGSSVTLTGGPGSSGGPLSLTTNPVTGAWSTSGLSFAGGNNSVTAISGNAGGSSNPATTSFSVVAPLAVNTNPAPLTVTPGTNTSAIAATALSPSGGVQPLTYSVFNPASGSATSSSGPIATPNGLVSINPTTGVYSYTPTAGYSGTDAIGIKVCDSSSPTPQCVSSIIPILIPPTVAITTPATNGTATLSPTISGTATPNAVVTINGGPGSTGGPVSVTADPSGNYSTTAITFPAGLASVTATATNAGGVSSPAVSSFTAVAPASLTVSGPVNVSTVASPTISGTATPNAVIVITNPAGQTVCNTTASSSGTFACGPINGLPTGTNNLTVTATTPGGSASQPISFTTVPAPTVAINGPAPGQVVATASPTISGTATPGSSVTLTAGPGSSGGPLSLTTNPVTGAWSTSGLSFVGGNNSVTAISGNAGGSSSPATTSFSVVAPLAVNTNPATLTATPGTSTSAIAATALSPSGGIQPLVYSVFNPASGSATSSSGPIATPNGLVSINPVTGVYSYTPTAGYSGTDAIGIKVCDSSSPTPQCVSSIIPILIPPTVAITTPATNGTATLSPTISGTATPNAVVTISGGPGSTGGPVSVTAGPTGAYSTTAITFPAGLASVTATATNAGGVSSPAVSSFTAVAPASLTVSGPVNVSTVASPTISGTATPNAVIVITNPAGQTVCNTTASSSGTFACGPINGLPTGTNNLTVTATTPGGSTSQPISFTTVVVPTIAILTPANNGTATTTPTVSGTATPLASVTVLAPNGQSCVTTASASGTYACSSLTFASGPASVTAIASNPGGTTSVVNTFTAVAPASLTLAPTGPSTTTAVVISGTATPGSPVVITGPGPVTLCSTTASTSGTFACSVTVPSGPTTLTVTACTSAGCSTATTSFTAVAPPSLTVTGPVGVSTTTSPTISGTATPNSVITITNPAGQTVCQTTASSTGNFACGPVTGLPTGTNNLTVTATTPGGSTSQPISFTTVTVPTVAILTPTNNGTATTTPVISGTATPNAVVTISGGPGSSGGPVSVTAGPTGAYSTTAITFPAGLASVTAIATNAGGTSSPAISSFTAVGPPSLTVTGPVGVSTTTSPTISGTATPNSVITITNPAGQTVCQTTADVNGVFLCGPISGLLTGPNTLTVTATTPAGSTSQPISFTTVAVPTVAILTPTNNGTATTTPVISGTATPNAVVTISGGPGSSGGPVSVTAGPTGVYSTTAITFPTGLASVTAIATNAGGTSSPAISSFTAVGSPSLTVATPPTGPTTQPISGTATPGSTVVIAGPGNPNLCTTTASASGTFTCSVTVPTGPSVLTVTASGPGGSTSVPVNVSAIAPPTVAILSPANGSVVSTTTNAVSGTAIANAVVTIAGVPGGPLTVTATNTGAYSLTGLTLPAGTYSVTATATTAGGTSTPAVSNFTTVAPGAPDLALSIGIPAPALLGGQISLIPITVTNVGGATANGSLAFSAILPAGLTSPLGSYTAGNGWSCLMTGTTVVCTNPNTGGLAIGASTGFNIRVLPMAQTQALSLTLSGSVTPVLNETNNINNLASRVLIIPGTLVSLPIRVFLQGALTRPGAIVSAVMRDNLRQRGLIPTTEPYTSLGYAHIGGGSGMSIANVSAVTAVTGPNAIVDWVMVELRSPTFPHAIVATRPALLQADGDIVETNGVSPVAFNTNGLSGTSFRVAVHHRNHLGVMTANPVSLTGVVPVVDFTLASTPVNRLPLTNLQTSTAPLALERGLLAMWAGNTNGDQTVILQGGSNDIDPIFFDIVNDIVGNPDGFTNYIRENVYSMADVDMDGRVIFQGADNEVDVIFFEIILHPDNAINQYINFIIRAQIP